MAKIEISTVINRPINEVFAFVANPENIPRWVSGSVEVKRTSEEPFGVSSTFSSVSKLVGRRMESASQVTDYEPNKKYATKSIAGPFPFHLQYIFEPVEGGTRINFIAEAEPGGFFKLAEPIMVRVVKRQFEADFDNLKDLMEAEAL